MAQVSAQQQNILNAVQAIQSAENVLTNQVNAATDPLSAIKLTHAYQHLDSCLSQLLQLQNLTDDAAFAASVATIKGQTSALQSDEKTIKGLVGDVDVATEVIGYIGKALNFITMIG
jgi:hypothetical protein